MAQIFQENGKYRVQIRRDGKYVTSRSGFDSKKAAEEWALAFESNLLYGLILPEKKGIAAPLMTLEVALKKYGEEITPSKKGADREQARLKHLQTLDFSKKPIDEVTDDDLTDFINQRRSEGLADATIRLDLMLFSAVFKTARQVWKIKIPNPVKDVAVPKNSKWRDRVLRDGEWEYLVKGFALACPQTPHLPELLTIAIETGMREGEMLAIDHDDIDLKARTIHLPDTKSGTPRDVPLSPVAIATIKKLPKAGRLFSISQDRLVRGFAEACEMGRILYQKERGKAPNKRFLADLHFHDLRHTAASKWAPYLTAPELAKAFGWKTLSLVMRYYQADATAIAKKMAKR